MIVVKISDLKTINYDQMYYWGNKEKIKLIDDIKNNGFDYNKGVITITKDYYLIDGHHRCKILADMYGPDYQISVKQYLISRRVYLFILILLLIITSPITIIYFLIKNGFKRNSD